MNEWGRACRSLGSQLLGGADVLCFCREERMAMTSAFENLLNNPASLELCPAAALGRRTPCPLADRAESVLLK